MSHRIAFVLLSALALVPIAQAAPESLAADGRVGVVADRQGLVLIRPAGRQRWTPLGARGLVFPGDRLRTETRGANALDLRLKGGARLTIGPGVLLDVAKDGSFDLLAGEMEALGTTAAPVTVRGPGGGAVKAESAVVVGVKDGKLAAITQPPKWLTGYRANTSDEWMGALLAQVDGREVPLAVGYHKVDVEIRDQVARTTIEESFVNATDARLEGVFRFPLPAEASIGGFGMWIGSEYVEADVVERERARQIYEDILRRKKDPGLLEWAGGNVFQARVFPIEPRSEKRIRLVYTEVLPLEGTTWRYRYALRSELLRKHPLRELQVNVRTVSTAALAEVVSPTHPEAKVTADAHTALVELSQRDVSPDKDFEVAGRLAATEGLTVVTHRRGEDGWFLLLLQPPDTGSAAWQRDLVPEGPPLDVILALDTSGSVDAEARKGVVAFATALLGQLGPEDRVRACTIDVETRWMAQEAKPADPDTADEVLRFLDARPPMGWTDLDAAFDALLAAAGPRTQVVYVGDGIGTSGDGDPVALAQRLRAKGAGTQATFHAVAPGSTYEKGVLDAVASLGGGSVRALREDPAGAAQRLLTEVATPLVKDVKVEVQGLRTARVYPETLPNLPLGTQHAVLGRFLPEGGAGKGTVIVTGTLAGKPVRFSAPLVVPGDEEGNSFLPRLWARRHLDALLAQGDAQAVKDDIVRFSTEYGILTPYTSLLVLENDEDRERYGVERRVHARDGEAEFAATRDKVSLEVARKAAKEARTWRVNLRRQMLRELSGLGRSRSIPVPEVALGEGPDAGGMLARALNSESTLLAFTGAGSGGGAGGYPLEAQLMDQMGRMGAMAAAPAPGGDPFLGAEGEGDVPALAEKEHGDSKSEDLAPAAKPGAMDARRLEKKAMDGGEQQEEAFQDADMPAPEMAPADAAGEWAADDGLLGERARGMGAPPPTTPSPSFGYVGPSGRPPMHAGMLGFPGAGRPVFDPPLPPEPPVGDDAALALLRRVFGSTDESLRLRIQTQGEALHPVRQAALGGPATRLLLRAPDRWFTRSAGPGWEPVEQSLDGGVVTTLSTGTRLARSWRGGPHAGWTVADVRRALGYPDARSVAGAIVAAQRAKEHGADKVVEYLALRIERPPGRSVELWLLDEKSGALLERRVISEDGTVQRTVFADSVEVGGLWWARKIERFDDRGRLVQRTAAAVEALVPADFDAAFAASLGGREDVLTLGPDLPKPAAARNAVAKGTAGFAERIVLLLDRMRVQRFDEAWAHAEAALGPVKTQPGADWIRLALLSQTRRGEDLRAHLNGVMLNRIAAVPALGWPLAARAYGLSGTLGPAEKLTLLASYEPAWTLGGKDPEARWNHGAARVQALHLAHRSVEARALTASRAAERPHDHAAALAQGQALSAAGDPDGAAAYYAKAIDTGGPWSEGERDGLEHQRSEILFARGRFTALVPLLAAWTKARPDAGEAWRQWVSALYYRGEEAQADRWVLDVLTTAGRGEAFPREEAARLRAAIGLALGQGWQWWSYKITPTLHAPLADLAERLLAHDDGRLELARWLWSDGRVTQTEPGRRARERVRAAFLAPGAVESAPLRRLDVLVGSVVPWSKDEIDDATFERVFAALTARVTREKHAGERALAAALAQRVAESRGEKDRVLDVLRAWKKAEKGRAADGVARTLFDRLLASAHDAAREAEAFALFAEVLPAERPKAWRMATAGNLLRALTTWTVDGRAKALLGTPEEQAARTRALARETEARTRREARAATADRLAAATWPEEAAPWATLERRGLLSESGKDLPEVARDAQSLVDQAERTEVTDLPAGHPLEPVYAVLRARAAVLIAHAASRRGAPEKLATDALAAFEARWADDRHDWRYETFRLLVALDRVADLRKALATWTTAPDAEPRWKRALAYLEAELGRLEPAVELLEGLRGVEGALTPGDLTALSTWLLALDQDARREQVLTARFELLDEWRLSQHIQQELGAISRRGPGVPDDLDPEVLPALRVLLAKSHWPQHHRWIIHSLYAATKDHRVLACFVDAVLGHSPQGAYGFLQQMTQIVAGVHEEAALDALRTAATQRLAAATRAPDRRALQYLLALVELRAGQVLLKDPGPARRAAAALAAAAGPLEEGELRPLVDFLRGLPVGTSGPLADERVRLLDLLARQADVASGDRLAVVRVLAQVLWEAKRHDDALERLLTARREARGAGDLRADHDLSGSLDTAVEWQAVRARFGEAAALLAEEIAAARSPMAREAMSLRLYRLWARGLKERAAFKIGRGEELFRAAMARIESAWAEQPSLAQGLHAVHVELYRAAKHVNAVPDVGAERVRFAAERLPALLVGGPNIVSNVTQAEGAALAELADPRSGLRFLLDRAAAEPRWFERMGADVWTDNNWRLAELRTKAEPLGPLEAPLLAYVLQHLEAMLLSDQHQSSSFWQSGNSYFWAAKVPEFMAAVLKTAEAAPESPTRQHLCGLVLNQMGRGGEAIGLLLAALERGALDRGGRHLLLDLLLRHDRFADALRVVDGLVAETPENLDLHMRRARALAGLGRLPDAVAALETGLSHVPGAKPPPPHSVAQVATLAVELGLHEPGVRWFEDAIRRSEGSPGMRGARANWRGIMARSLASLGRVDEAVAAAAAAVVGTRQEPGLERPIQDQDLLEKVLLQVRDLPAFTSAHDAKVAKEGADAPVLRKAFARVYMQRKNYARAAEQLEALRALVPNDAVVLKVLADLYRKAGNEAKSLEVLEARLRVDPGATDAWEDLGRRWLATNRPADAERAFTNAIEMRPLEPDGHRLLARIRREQGRLVDSAARWGHVTKVRPLEPEARLEEALDLIATKQPERAKPLLDEVLSGTWEERFGDVKKRAAELRARLP